MLSLRPVTSRIRAKLNRNFFELADEVRCIDGPAVWQTQEAICLPDDLSRVTGHYHELCRERDLASVRGDPLTQGGSFARLYRDVIVADGCVMVGGGVFAITDTRRSPVLTGILERIPEAVLCSTRDTEQYFGHWLHDGLTHELWATDNGLVPLVLTSPPVRVHEAGYRAVTGQRARVTERARVARLWMLDDQELNRSRVERLKRVRAIVRRSAVGKGPRKVFLARGASGSGRSLVNEAEIVSHLQGRSFAILHPEQESPQAIINTLADADLILGVEGSAFAHLTIAGKEGATWAVIMPPTRTNMIIKIQADLLGMRFAFTVGEDAGNGNVRQPIGRLRTLMEML